LAELSIHPVRERIAQYQGDGYSPATVNGYIRSVKTLLNWALREDYDIMVNPRALAKVKEPRRVMPHLSTQEEIVALLSRPD
jgi:site-specific recombinase XerD